MTLELHLLQFLFEWSYFKRTSYLKLICHKSCVIADVPMISHYRYIAQKLCSKPRKPHRARGWYVATEELPPSFRHRSLPDLIKDPSFHTEVEMIIQQRDMFPDLSRGDILFFEPHLGMRNEGRLIYDGRSVHTLDYTFHLFGVVPAEFQVAAEFPVTYWNDLLENNRYVPFDVSEHLPDLSYEEVLVDSDTGQFYLPFIGIYNELYAIYSPYRMTLTKAQFLQVLNGISYVVNHYNLADPFPVNNEITSDRCLVIDESDVHRLVEPSTYYDRDLYWRSSTPDFTSVSLRDSDDSDLWD